MKGITPLILIVGILALLLLLSNRPASIIEDCSRIEQAALRVPYSQNIAVNIGNFPGSFLPDTDYGYALLVTGVPPYATVKDATATRTYLGPDSFGIGKTAINAIAFGGDIPGGRCGNQMIFSYARSPLQQAFSAGGGNGWEGTYNLKYDIAFNEINPIITPIPTPKQRQICPQLCISMWELSVPPIACVHNSCGSGCGPDNVNSFSTETECKAKIVQQGNRIPVLSDIFDTVKFIIAGIITFVALPFIPP